MLIIKSIKDGIETEIAFEGKQEEVVRKAIIEPGLCVIAEGFEIFPDQLELEIGIDLKITKPEGKEITEKFKTIDIIVEDFSTICDEEMPIDG